MAQNKSKRQVWEEVAETCARRRLEHIVLLDTHELPLVRQVIAAYRRAGEQLPTIAIVEIDSTAYRRTRTAAKKYCAQDPAARICVYHHDVYKFCHTAVFAKRLATRCALLLDDWGGKFSLKDATRKIVSLPRVSLLATTMTARNLSPTKVEPKIHEFATAEGGGSALTHCLGHRPSTNPSSAMMVYVIQRFNCQLLEDRVAKREASLGRVYMPAYFFQKYGTWHTKWWGYKEPSRGKIGEALLAN